MKLKLIGSMLSPFCYYKCGNVFWIMFFGFQIKKIAGVWGFNRISFKQWTCKIFNRKELRIKK